MPTGARMRIWFVFLRLCAVDVLYLVAMISLIVWMVFRLSIKDCLIGSFGD